jgi:hypothetical protein
LAKLCAQPQSRLSEPGTQPDAPQVLHLLQIFLQHARRRVSRCSFIGMMASSEKWALDASSLPIHVRRRSCAPALSQPVWPGAADNAHRPHAAAAAAVPSAARPLEPHPDLQFDQIEKRPRMLLSLCLRTGVADDVKAPPAGGCRWCRGYGGGTECEPSPNRRKQRKKRSKFSLLFSYSSR